MKYISLLLARKREPYSDEEWIANSSILTFTEYCGEPKVKIMVHDIALSRDTVMRIDGMSGNVKEQNTSILVAYKYFSLAFDESCNNTDNAQLCVLCVALTKMFM
jgi:hypothetical protein